MHGHHQEPQVLHSSHHGYLIRCSCCDHFQLAYGTFRLIQDLEELQSFSHLINRYAHKYLRRADRRRRDIFIDSPHAGFGLLFSADDLDRINDILQRSLLVLAAGDRVRLQ